MDSKLKGFGVKVTPKGRRSYFLYYRTRDGRERRPKIGDHGPITCDQAREIARQWLAEVAAGGDPSARKGDARRASTVKDLCERYLSEYAAHRKKATSFRNDQRMIEKRIATALGHMKTEAVGRADISRLHHSLRSTPYEANRGLGAAVEDVQSGRAVGPSAGRHQSLPAR